MLRHTAQQSLLLYFIMGDNQSIPRLTVSRTFDDRYTLHDLLVLFKGGKCSFMAQEEHFFISDQSLDAIDMDYLHVPLTHLFGYTEVLPVWDPASNISNASCSEIHEWKNINDSDIFAVNH